MVKRYFSKHPVLWELLLLIAPGEHVQHICFIILQHISKLSVPGALLKCKSVVASLLASEISFWKHCRKQQTKQALSDLQATIKTVRVIVLVCSRCFLGTIQYLLYHFCYFPRLG